jgi:hypothetical protein
LNIANFHLGSGISLLLSHKLLFCPPWAQQNQGDANLDQNINVSARVGARLEKYGSVKSSLIVGTLDGGMGILIPVDEKTYCRLSILQQIMSTTVKSVCGLNPSDFRVISNSMHRLERKKGVLDGPLLWNFANLEGKLQDELASAMGTTVDIIFDNLLELDRMTNFY